MRWARRRHATSVEFDTRVVSGADERRGTWRPRPAEPVLDHLRVVPQDGVGHASGLRGRAQARTAARRAGWVQRLVSRRQHIARTLSRSARAWACSSRFADEPSARHGPAAPPRDPEPCTHPRPARQIISRRSHPSPARRFSMHGGPGRTPPGTGAPASVPDGCVVLCDQDQGISCGPRRSQPSRRSARPRSPHDPGSFAQARLLLLRQWGSAPDVVLADLGFRAMDGRPRPGIVVHARRPARHAPEPEAPVTAAELVATLSERRTRRDPARSGRRTGRPTHRPENCAFAQLSRSRPPLSSPRSCGRLSPDPGTIDPSTRTFQAYASP